VQLQKILKKGFYATVSFMFLVILLPQIIILYPAWDKIVPLKDIPVRPIAIVFGASVYANEIPSDVVFDRITSAAELYHAKKVQKLLMTGDNSEKYYNESKVMKDVALQLGVAENDIVLDTAGLRTYDSCARAHQVFGISKAILVTQRFHLSRAIYLCEKFGIQSFGYAADKRMYDKQNFNQFREFFARVYAYFEVNLFRHDPEYSD
jgi:vancomycin permeability regulator SanA